MIARRSGRCHLSSGKPNDHNPRQLEKPQKEKDHWVQEQILGCSYFRWYHPPVAQSYFYRSPEPLPDISGRGNAHGLHLLKAGYLADFHRASPHAQGSEQYHYGIFQVARSCFAPTDQADPFFFKNRL